MRRLPLLLSILAFSAASPRLLAQTSQAPLAPKASTQAPKTNPQVPQADSQTPKGNPFLGTWKLNLGKSKFAGVPAPKSLTRTVVADGASGARYSFEGIAADDSPIAFSFSTQYDGKDSPVTGKGMPGGADSISFKPITNNKVETTLKRGGKEIGSSIVGTAMNRRVTLVNSRGVLPDGKPFHTQTYFEKQ